MVFNGKTFLAVIPARGGSKRLPRKNVLDLAGKPLIAWTIEAAKQSKYIDHFVVSTDDQEITDVSKKFGAEVLTRPGELATDAASSVDVVLHAVNAQHKQYDYVILLQPTSPLRTSQHIDEAIELLFEKNANAVISVCETEHSPLWANTLPEDGSMDNFIREEVKGKRSQDLPTYYRLNGSIYICNIERLYKENNLITERDVFSYKMDRRSSIDIDQRVDFEFSEFFLKKYDV
ncbi:MAG: acylneuraminate cytidylyltransferase family protein [Paludibacteraceae bacterium]|nr:acylneuraminate cytidylyltransferase family protein [Paludibacteraceae bacterium]